MFIKTGKSVESREKLVPVMLSFYILRSEHIIFATFLDSYKTDLQFSTEKVKLTAPYHQQLR